MRTLFLGTETMKRMALFKRIYKLGASEIVVGLVWTSKPPIFRFLPLHPLP